ncbi:hypothetical protein [Pyrodictium abyssi]|uniref:hypothetical protein n=1 Tax=Pyrodictium abyssi TaxID=54256 RepID=UPI0030C6D3AB
MKLILENFGPVRSAELSLGDVTLPLGPPNTGKSYAMRALYSSALVLDEHVAQHLVDNVARRLRPEAYSQLVEKASYIQTAAKLLLASLLAGTLLASRKALNIITLKIMLDNSRRIIMCYQLGPALRIKSSL